MSETNTVNEDSSVVSTNYPSEQDLMKQLSEFSAENIQQDDEGTEYYELPGSVLVKSEFPKKFTGIQFFYRQFTDYQAAVIAFGEDKLLDIINNALESSTKVRARNKIPKYPNSEEDQKKAIEDIIEKDPIIFSAKDALEYVPGEKELTYESLIALSKRLKKEGDKTGARAAVKRALAMLNDELEEDDED